MQKYLLYILLAFVNILAATEDQKTKELKEFLKKYPSSYQDIIFRNQTVFTGSQQCPIRYELIKPMLNDYLGKEFSVLDVGASQGYFDFKIAHEYRGSHCFMIESGSGYATHKEMLFELCHLNDYLPHVTLLSKSIDLNDLILLNREAHFDVVLAFLVVHMIKRGDGENDYEAILDEMIKLGNNVIIEVPNNRSGARAEKHFKKYSPVFLGTVRRLYIKNSNTGNVYWFQNEPTQTILELSPQTSEYFKKIY